MPSIQEYLESSAAYFSCIYILEEKPGGYVLVINFDDSRGIDKRIWISMLKIDDNNTSNNIWHSTQEYKGCQDVTNCKIIYKCQYNEDDYTDRFPKDFEYGPIEFIDKCISMMNAPIILYGIPGYRISDEISWRKDVLENTFKPAIKSENIKIAKEIYGMQYETGSMDNEKFEVTFHGPFDDSFITELNEYYEIITPSPSTPTKLKMSYSDKLVLKADDNIIMQTASADSQDIKDIIEIIMKWKYPISCNSKIFVDTLNSKLDKKYFYNYKNYVF